MGDPNGTNGMHDPNGMHIKYFMQRKASMNTIVQFLTNRPQLNEGGRSVLGYQNLSESLR
ncbi:hypothetical protein [uncultured Paraglaciecola sp.]|uniref:hypothetical protein n=1 Tax=uncultured Paraglaciecola sp. TaxID=1765024 RepID=UPI0026096160|nr:hypothetical protein [uncultured Paraglaciecola sp.]